MRLRWRKVGPFEQATLGKPWKHEAQLTVSKGGTLTVSARNVEAAFTFGSLQSAKRAAWTVGASFLIFLGDVQRDGKRWVE